MHPASHMKPQHVAYEHQEYPKWLHFDDKDSVLVEDAKEEAATIKAHAKPAPEKLKTEPSPAVPQVKKQPTKL